MFVDKTVLDGIKKYINDLQREQEGLIQTLSAVSASVEGLIKRANMLEEALATKADITHVREIVKESVVNHTADSIQVRVIKGSEINETK
ncbi:hypothetical protein A9498_03280 [Bacillus thuringiensis serovar coreanensis]|nr:hypothetical protein A9498_03280 [Bacillus thuringiensis serovar coreanensis]